MADPHARKITVDLSGPVEPFDEACRRCGQHLAELVRQREHELIWKLLQGQGRGADEADQDPR